MSDNWFYTHANAVHGPVSTEQLLGLVKTGDLLPEDKIWPESAPPAAAVRAEAALSFPSRTPTQAIGSQSEQSPLPEWMRTLIDAGLDVRTLESLPHPPAKSWLADVRRLEQPSRTPGDGSAARDDESFAPYAADDGASPPTGPDAAEASPAAWPHSQDYNEAIQNLASSFADPDLRGGDPVIGPLGMPLPCSGNFADVYQVCCPDGARWAVKCFTRAAPGLRERYREISRHLRRAKLPFMVEFTYLEQGVRVAGRWFPVLKMHWVEGLTLNQFVGEYADNPAMLEALFKVWARMARYLRAAEVGHGDLQHGNVLLAPGSGPHSLALRLIDYDGMWIPALAEKNSGEVGHPAYQHPQRIRDKAYGPDVDRFPLLLIATALRALMVEGRPLWQKYDTGDGLLFKQADLDAPTQSPLFHDLVRSADPLTATLAGRVIKALRGGLESAPLLEEVLSGTPPAPRR